MKLAENDVREYLLYLQDPSSFPVDTSNVDKKIEAENDPIEKLRLYSERRKALDIKPILEDKFISSVKPWADAEDIDGEVFLDLGVEREVLILAGLLEELPKTTSKKRIAPKNIARDVITAYSRGTTFTVFDVARDAGCKTDTVRRFTKQLEKENLIERAGLAARRVNGGRKPDLFIRL